MEYQDVISQDKLCMVLGISRPQVRRLIDKGIFKLDDNHKLSLSQAQQSYTEYQEGVETQKRNKSRQSALRNIDNLKKKIDKLNEEDNFENIFRSWMENIDQNPMQVQQAAKAYLLSLQTKEQKMKVEEMERRLIPIERINHDAEEVVSLIRNKLFTIPSRVATVCEGRTARDIEEIIEDEINNSLEELQKLFVC